jgi:GT2 family glycosyltransferase
MSRRIDVVIVSFNTRDDLGTCLTSLHAPPPRRLARIVVVDNASTDGSTDMVRADWPGVDLVPLETNVGFAAANNLAIARTDAALVLLLNSDTVVPEGAIDTLADRLEAAGAVAAGPRLVDTNGRPEISFGPMLSPTGEARQWFRGRLARAEGTWARRRVARLLAAERTVDWVTGACLLVDRRAAVEAGLLDERFFMYEEDVDFCAALRARGGRILFTPEAEVVHRRGGSANQTPSATRAHYDRSHLAFYEKHAPGWARLLRLWLRLRGRSIQ